MVLKAALGVGAPYGDVRTRCSPSAQECTHRANPTVDLTLHKECTAQSSLRLTTQRQRCHRALHAGMSWRSPGRAAICCALTHCLSRKAATLHPAASTWSPILCAAVRKGRSACGANLRISSEIREELEPNHQHCLLHHTCDLNMS